MSKGPNSSGYAVMTARVATRQTFLDVPLHYVMRKSYRQGTPGIIERPRTFTLAPWQNAGDVENFEGTSTVLELCLSSRGRRDAPCGTSPGPPLNMSQKSNVEEAKRFDAVKLKRSSLAWHAQGEAGLVGYDGVGGATDGR